MTVHSLFYLPHFFISSSPFLSHLPRRRNCSACYIPSLLPPYFVRPLLLSLSLSPLPCPLLRPLSTLLLPVNGICLSQLFFIFDVQPSCTQSNLFLFLLLFSFSCDFHFLSPIQLRLSLPHLSLSSLNSHTTFACDRSTSSAPFPLSSAHFAGYSVHFTCS